MTTVNQMTTQAMLLICTIIPIKETMTTDQIDNIKTITITEKQSMIINTTIKIIQTKI